MKASLSVSIVLILLLSESCRINKEIEKSADDVVSALSLVIPDSCDITLYSDIVEFQQENGQFPDSFSLQNIQAGLWNDCRYSIDSISLDILGEDSVQINYKRLALRTDSLNYSIKKSPILWLKEDSVFISYNIDKSSLFGKTNKDTMDNEEGFILRAKIKDRIFYTNITNEFSCDDFEDIKHFVLKNGDRKTYRTFDGNNPHYDFGEFSVFFGSDIGQFNMNNDEDISDFNQLMIADWDSNIRYYEIIIVRDGDIKAGKMWLKEGMKEGNVYLVDIYKKGLHKLKRKLPYFIETMKAELAKDIK